MTTLAERRHLARVASLACFICGATPCEVHHVRSGQGMGQRASNWLVIALCPDDHVGRRGIHGDKSEMRLRKLTELDLLAITLRRLEA